LYVRRISFLPSYFGLYAEVEVHEKKIQTRHQNVFT